MGMIITTFTWRPSSSSSSSPRTLCRPEGGGEEGSHPTPRRGGSPSRGGRGGVQEEEEEEEEGRQVNFFSDHLHPISYFFYLQNGDQLSATPHLGGRGEQLIVSCSRWR